jgi:GMP synthase-like glutamine amidotransferase
MILLVSTCKESLSEEEYVKPVAKELGECKILHYSKVGTEAKNHDRIIICGTALMDNDYLDHLDHFTWIKEYEGRLLGICSGMQVIGLCFGAKLTACKEIGIVNVKACKPNGLMEGAIDAYALHSKGLTDLSNFDVLAESDSCVHAVKHSAKEIYGVMFHPEVRNPEILRSFLKI